MPPDANPPVASTTASAGAARVRAARCTSTPVARPRAALHADGVRAQHQLARRPPAAPRPGAPPCACRGPTAGWSAPPPPARRGAPAGRPTPRRAARARPPRAAARSRPGSSIGRSSSARRARSAGTSSARACTGAATSVQPGRPDHDSVSGRASTGWPRPARGRLSARSAGKKSRSARRPATANRAGPSRRPAAIAAGATAVGRATPTAVGSSRLRRPSPSGAQVGDHLAEPAEGLVQHAAEPGVRVLRALPAHARDRRADVVDPVGRVPQHVHRAGREAQAPRPLRHHAHLRPELRPGARRRRAPRARPPPPRRASYAAARGPPRGGAPRRGCPGRSSRRGRAWRIWSP